MLRVLEFVLFLLFAFFRSFITTFIIMIYKLFGKFISARAKLEWEEWMGGDLKAEHGDNPKIAFEVSSEGELEQALPLMRYFKSCHFEIELLYASFSAKIKAIKEGKILGAKTLVMPILTYSIWPSLCGFNILKIIKAKTLVLCRYDFYPELLFWKIFSAKKSLVLISASLKNKKIGKGFFLPSLFWHWLYDHFDLIICASPLEKERFISLGLSRDKLHLFDFRIQQIFNRQKNADPYLLTKLPGEYVANLKALTPDQKIILGNAYKEDLQILKDKKIQELISLGKLHILIAPHSLNKENIRAMWQELEQIVNPLKLVLLDSKKNRSFDLLGGVFFCEIPGILCELYTLFSCAYVAGGFHRSVHSILEPYLAGNVVITGPKIHRSTEFDLAQNNSPHFVLSVEELSDVAQVILEKLNLLKIKETREIYKKEIELWSQNFRDENLQIICQKILKGEEDKLKNVRKRI